MDNMHGGKRPGSGRKKGNPNVGRRGKQPKKYLIKIKSYKDYIAEETKKKNSDYIYKLFYKFGKKVL